MHFYINKTYAPAGVILWTYQHNSHGNNDLLLEIEDKFLTTFLLSTVEWQKWQDRVTKSLLKTGWYHFGTIQLIF